MHLYSMILTVGLFASSSAVAEDLIVDAPAPIEDAGDPDDQQGTNESDALIDPSVPKDAQLAPFTYGTIGLVATECLGVGGFLGGSAAFVAVAVVALAGGGVLPIIGLVAAYGFLLGGLCGFGPLTAIVSSASAAAAAESTKRSGLPFILGSIPGVAIGIIGGLFAGGSLLVIGPTGYLTQGLALLGGSSEGLPLELPLGLALQAAAGPIALAGALGASYFLGNSLDEVVGEENPDVDATPSVATLRAKSRSHRVAIGASTMRY